MMDESAPVVAQNPTSKSSIESQSFSAPINGVSTDFLINTYLNRYFIIITQTGHIGSLVSVEKDSAQVEKEASVVYNIRVLLGKDDEDVHIGARFLAGKLEVEKPILFSFCIKDFGPAALKSIAEVLKEQLKN